jgi:hypothetical protein
MGLYILIMGVLSFGQIIIGLRVIRSRRFSVKHRKGIPLFETVVTTQLDGYAAIFFGRCLLVAGMTIFLLWLLNIITDTISQDFVFLLAILITVLIGIFGQSRATAIQKTQNQ